MLEAEDSLHHVVFVSADGVWCRRRTRASGWVKSVSQYYSTVVRLKVFCVKLLKCCGNIWTVLSLPRQPLSVIPLSSFLTAQCGLQFSPRGLRPSCSLMAARHLDQNTMGYLQWRCGLNSAMTTSLVRDTKSSHFTLALQVNRSANKSACKVDTASRS